MKDKVIETYENMFKEDAPVATEVKTSLEAVANINNYFKTRYKLDNSFALELGAPGKYGPTKTVDIIISPENFGILSLAFENAGAYIKLGSFEEDGATKYMANLDFKWQHPRGNNGYNVRMLFDADGKFLQLM